MKDHKLTSCDRDLCHHPSNMRKRVPPGGVRKNSCYESWTIYLVLVVTTSVGEWVIRLEGKYFIVQKKFCSSDIDWACYEMQQNLSNNMRALKKVSKLLYSPAATFWHQYPQCLLFMAEKIINAIWHESIYRMSSRCFYKYNLFWFARSILKNNQHVLYFTIKGWKLKTSGFILSW